MHEGEIFEDNFRVAKISSSAVELVENSAPSAEPTLMAEIGQGAAQAPADKARQRPPACSRGGFKPRRKSPIRCRFCCQRFTTIRRQELGYVERADGRVEAIVAEGEHVRLAQATKSFANSFHVPAPSPANVEVAKASPPAINPPDSLAPNPNPFRQTPPLKRLASHLWLALGSEPSTGGEPQGIPGNNAELESAQFGIVQPEPLADYSGPRFQPRDVAPVTHAGPQAPP